MNPSPTAERARRFAGILALPVLALGGCGDERDRLRLESGRLAERARRAASSLAVPAPSPPQPDAGIDGPAAPPTIADGPEPTTLEAQREALFARMAAELTLSPETMAEVRRIFEASKFLGQGNPAVTRHPMTRAECRKIRAAANVVEGGDAACGAKHMARVPDAAGGDPPAARVCIDCFEFPNVPCEYPVVYARANEAALLCRTLGKRICDAHEWEGACAGAVRPTDDEYAWGRARQHASHSHNQSRERTWAYGATKDHARCATGGRKSDRCVSGGWKPCGSNTFPAGAFPRCTNGLGVFDLHGNAAEHMNFPTTPEELASRGGSGRTEMKGSWFVFGKGPDPHEDDCRWRARDWHPSKLMDPESHRNYHLGFRCCKDLP